MRNLGLIVALWLVALLPTNSLALGLGEIEVNSFLNQPLNAEIEVISARPGEIDDLLVSLASREAFTRAGLSRPRHLLDLRFAVKKSEAGDEAVIVVTTRSSIKEPFLNFLIEADWSKGRVLREFTVLLDPPFYADQPAPVETVSQTAEQPVAEDPSVSEIVEQSGVTSTVDSSEFTTSGETITEPIALSEGSAETVSSEPEPESDVSSIEPVAASSQDIIEAEVYVVKGDTLWSIASRYRDDDHSMSQVMLAFQRVNPDAFNDGNINNMKVGAVLRAPSADELNAIDKQESYAEVLVQNGLWDEYVERVTGVSPAVASEDIATGSDAVMQDESAGEEATSELSLLLPEDGDNKTAGIGDTSNVDELRTKLALAEEELEASRIENQELESRISELQARLSKVEELQKMIEIEDDSLAQLQSDQAETAEAMVQDELPPGTDTITEAIEADEAALLEELIAEEAAAQAQEQAEVDGTVVAATDDTMTEDSQAGDPGTDEMTSDEIVLDEIVSDEIVSDEMVAEALESETAVAPPAPVIVTETTTRSPSIFDGFLPPDIIDMIPTMPSMGGILGDPIILAAVGGVIVLLLVLIILKRRKGSAEDEPDMIAGGNEDLFAADEEEELTPIHLTEGAEPEATDIKMPTDEDLLPAEPEVGSQDDLAATAIISPEDMPQPEAPVAAAAPEQDDVLNEVDVYLAYGLYDNAEDLLNTSLAENPDRADYRSKLLDTYFATKKSDAFVGEAEKLKSMGNVANGYWDRVQVMGYELAPDNSLFSDAKDSTVSAADLEISKPQEADFDLGASEDDDTNFSATDFNLGEDDTGADFTGTDFSETSNMGEAGNIAATQQIPQVDELPEIDLDDDDTNIRTGVKNKAESGQDLPDDIGDELEFSIDEAVSTDANGMELSNDLDLATVGAVADVPLTAEDVNLDDIAMEFDIDADEAAAVDDISEVDFSAEFESALEEADSLDVDDSEIIPFESEDPTDFAPAESAIGDEAAENTAILDEDETNLTDGADETSHTDTAVITPNYEDTEVVPQVSGNAKIDPGAEQSAIRDDDETSLGTAELHLDTAEISLSSLDDDDDDISIIDFGGEDFAEPTDIIESTSGSDDAVIDIDDEDNDAVKTGTFAPGDFEEPTGVADSISDIDDIGDLMLPDDVDEVSTKLDLARAFIDMGDTEGARGSLEEVMSEGNEEQKTEAKSLLGKI